MKSRDEAITTNRMSKRLLQRIHEHKHRKDAVSSMNEVRRMMNDLAQGREEEHKEKVDPGDALILNEHGKPYTFGVYYTARIVESKWKEVADEFSLD